MLSLSIASIVGNSVVGSSCSFYGIAGFYLTDACSSPLFLIVTTKDISRYGQMFPRSS
jgi:hypothetical protein